MRRWLKIALPLGIAAVLVSVLAIGLQAPSGKAADCIQGASGYTGRAASTVTYEFDYCSDPTFNLAVSLLWGNAKKDLALRVTSPTGVVYFEDSHGGFFESLLVPSSLSEGTWTVEVINTGRGSVSYELNIAVGY